MAGYAYGLDEGGAIPDDEIAPTVQGTYPTDTGDDSGAAPVLTPPPDNSGAPPVVPLPPEQEQEQEQDQGPAIDFQASHVPGNAKRILQYLMGAGAAHPEVADKFATAVKLEHPGTSDDDANLISVLKAKQQGGDEAASALLQSHMQQYGAKNAFAYAALSGTEGKPADPNAAAKAATEASKHMLDGSTASFTYNPQGGNFTATVKYPHSDAHQNFTLTPQQFAAYTKPGGAGQWDQVLSGGGVASALTKLTSASQDNGQSGGEDAEPTSAGHEELRYVPPQQGSAKPAAAQSDDDSDDAKEAARLDAQSRKIFPMLSQERQRQAWIAQQQSHSADLQNKIDVENARGTFKVQTEDVKNKGRLGAANIRGNAQIEAAKQRAVADVARQASISQREDDRRRAKLFTTLVNNSNIASQADIDKAARAAGVTLGGAGPSQPTQSATPQNPTQRAAPRAGGRSFTAANVPPAEQRQVGDLVQTAKGTFQWTGSGWQHQ